MADYYDSLHEYSKKVFDLFKYRPRDAYDANNYLFKRCGLNDTRDIFVNPKTKVAFNGRPLKFVKLTVKKPLMACVPEVWQSMKTNHQLKTIVRIYNYFFEKIIGDKPDKPALMFFTDYNLIDNVISACFVKENYLYLPLHRILCADNCLELVATLVHEIEHFRQEYQKRELANWLKQNDYDFSKLTKDQKHLFYRYSNHVETMISNFYHGRNEKFLNYMMTKSKLTKENIDLWIKLEASKDHTWDMLKQLPYAFCYKEVLSQDIEMQALKLLYDTYASKSACKPFDYEVKRMSVLTDLRQAGFQLNDEAVQDITNLGYLANMVDDNDSTVYFEILNYLLEVYKAKKVDKPFIENYDEFEDEYFESQRKALLKQKNNEKEKENEIGSETD